MPTLKTPRFRLISGKRAVYLVLGILTLAYLIYQDSVQSHGEKLEEFGTHKYAEMTWFQKKLAMLRGEATALAPAPLNRGKRNHTFRATEMLAPDAAFDIQDYSCTGESLNFETGEKHTLGIVIPFRQRHKQLGEMVNYMEEFLEKQNVKAQFWIVNQLDEYRFNRGELLNIGATFAKEAGCDYIALHDVDLIPLKQELRYTYPAPGVYHVSAPGLHPKYKFSKFFGGIIIMRHEDFEGINGFSNEYWGWGKEDDEFRRRAILEGQLAYNRPPKLRSGMKHTFQHLHGEDELRDVARTDEQKEMFQFTRMYQGYNTTNADALCVKQTLAPNTRRKTIINFVNVALYCDKTLTPWCVDKEQKKK